MKKMFYVLVLLLILFTCQENGTAQTVQGKKLPAPDACDIERSVDLKSTKKSYGRVTDDGNIDPITNQAITGQELSESVNEKIADKEKKVTVHFKDVSQSTCREIVGYYDIKKQLKEMQNQNMKVFFLLLLVIIVSQIIIFGSLQMSKNKIENLLDRLLKIRSDKE